MKMNLSNAFDEFDLNNAEKIPRASLKAVYDNETAEKIKTRVLSRLALGEKKKPRRFRLGTGRFGRLVAAAAAVAIFAGGISAGAVGAAAYFKPDSKISQYFQYNGDDDMTTLGQNLNITQAWGDYEITLTQVLSDNNTMYLLFESTPIDGLTPVSGDITLKTTCDSLHSYSYGIRDGVGNFCVTFSGLRGLTESDKIDVTINDLSFSDNETGTIDWDIREAVEMHFSFYANEADVQRQLNIPDTAVIGDVEYSLKNCTVSPLGFYCDLAVGFDEDYGNALFDKIKEATKSITLEMKDGTVYSKDRDNFGGSIQVEAEDSEIVGYFDVQFEKFINIDDIKSITVLGTVIYEAQ